MRKQMINFAIPKPLLAAVGQQAKREIKPRSELLRDAIRLYLNQRQRWETVFRYGQRKAKTLNLKPGDVEELVDEYRRGK